MQTTIEVGDGRLPGRPPIGPKAQAAVSPDIYEAVKKEAEARGCNKADVWREIIELGWTAWNGER